MCPECAKSKCPVARAAGSLLGAWARERKRQGVSLFESITDPGAMEAATDEQVTEFVRAVADKTCSCACHAKHQKVGR